MFVPRKLDTRERRRGIDDLGRLRKVHGVLLVGWWVLWNLVAAWSGPLLDSRLVDFSSAGTKNGLLGLPLLVEVASVRRTGSSNGFKVEPSHSQMGGVLRVDFLRRSKAETVAISGKQEEYGDGEARTHGDGSCQSVNVFLGNVCENRGTRRRPLSRRTPRQRLVSKI